MEYRGQNLADFDLAVVVIDFDAVAAEEFVVMGPDKGGDLPGQPAGSIHSVAGLLLLNGEALVADIHLPDEGSHFVEYPAPLLDGQKGIVLFLANDGAGMDAVAVQAQIIERTVQSGGCLGAMLARWS